MAEPIVKVRVDECSGTIILNRPNRRNALSRGMLAEITQGFRDLHQQKKVRAVILTSSDDVFCSGYDISEMHSLAQAEQPDFQSWHTDATAYRDLVITMLQFPKPIIAAINGPAYGAGVGLALAADIVLGTNMATFSIPAPRRGIVAGMVAPLLVHRIGGGLANYYMLTSNPMTSQRAAELGIVHEIIEADFLWARAHEIATELEQSAHEAVSLTKRMLNETIGEHLSTQLTAGAAVAATSKTTEAAKEGMAAFMEKRLPEWP